jgi:hypothetical protein
MWEMNKLMCPPRTVVRLQTPSKTAEDVSINDLAGFLKETGAGVFLVLLRLDGD